ncbi:MAG: hypothetical protein ACXAE3_05185 [Candidatus Kariarchaeaceae archaeon]|jgi:hypothetical protein
MSSQIYPLGSYKISRVGNSFKISVPPIILEKWGLKNDDAESESPNVYVYAENRDGKTEMVRSFWSPHSTHLMISPGWKVHERQPETIRHLPKRVPPSV